jgi:LPXTG-motif cell wall-anchored protein
VGGFLPTAGSCDSQPTIQAKNPTNIRRGPGINYPIVGQLVFLEVRFILGRAADATWWLIQLDGGATGWVADEVVTVQGYIGGVPIVPAPAINGQTPTPGAPWNPTPLPFCTVTPTATAVPSATPSPTTAVSEASASSTDLQPTTEALETLPPTETPLPQPTQTAVAPPTLPPAVPTNQPAVDPIEASASGSTTDWLLPIAGLLLVAGGAAAFMARRKN